MSSQYENISTPKEGEPIEWDGKQLKVPSEPIIPQIEGDGIGKDVSPAAKKVLKAAAQKTGHDIHWMDIHAGETAKKIYGEYLPQETLDAIEDFRVALKGPLTTPVSGGFRSLNVTIRQKLDLYACFRPVYYLEGVPSPMKNPGNMDMAVFRENTEDVYAGIEWKRGTKEAETVRKFLGEELKTNIPSDSGIGFKPISERESKRLIRKAIDYALEHRDRYQYVTLVHKGNIMKFTEGAFRNWGYKEASESFGEATITEDEVYKKYNGSPPDGKIVIKDRIADMLFQQVLLRPDEFGVIATPNLNGDYISDALAAQIGGLGMAPGANIGDECAVFEATHGTAPKYAGLDKVNPSSLILSGAMMLDYIGWGEAGDLIRKGLGETVESGDVTYDLARQIRGSRTVGCSEFAKAIVETISRP